MDTVHDLFRVGARFAECLHFELAQFLETLSAAHDGERTTDPMSPMLDRTSDLGRVRSAVPLVEQTGESNQFLENRGAMLDPDLTQGVVDFPHDSM